MLIKQSSRNTYMSSLCLGLVLSPVSSAQGIPYLAEVAIKCYCVYLYPENGSQTSASGPKSAGYDGSALLTTDCCRRAKQRKCGNDYIFNKINHF